MFCGFASVGKRSNDGDDPNIGEHLLFGGLCKCVEHICTHSPLTDTSSETHYPHLPESRVRVTNTCLLLPVAGDAHRGWFSECLQINIYIWRATDMWTKKSVRWETKTTLYIYACECEIMVTGGANGIKWNCVYFMGNRFYEWQRRDMHIYVYAHRMIGAQVFCWHRTCTDSCCGVYGELSLLI